MQVCISAAFDVLNIFRSGATQSLAADAMEQHW
jgi:hypothetical protein